MSTRDKPVVIITGAGGDIGSSLATALKDDYRVVGLDRDCSNAPVDCIEADITSDDSVELAFRKVHKQYGNQVAAVVHLAAYFDFTGEESPLYQTVNVEGTRRLMRALQDFEVEQFVYSGTMLVHEPASPGQIITEDTPIVPTWAYPRSKATTEEVIRQECRTRSCVLLHLAGLYDDTTAVPTLSHQIARIYERSLKSHLFPGDMRAGQALVHKEDMIDAFRRAIDRRRKLPAETSILIGEADAMSFGELQSEIGRIIHGEAAWSTIGIPKLVAKPAAWIEERSEPIVPDDIDQGEKPFIRPFMVDMADQHYALDITRARELLGWSPRHSIRKALPGIIAALKKDPAKWYRANGITLPPWMETVAEALEEDAETLRRRHVMHYREAHRQGLWAPFLSLGVATWLLTAPPLLGYRSIPLAWSDTICGIAIFVLSLLSLSWRFGWARWANATVGLWLLFAPLVFWTESAAAYLNDTVMGAAVIGLSVLVRPTPGLDPVAATTGPTVPPGWSFSPSSWTQRMPIILLAFIGLYVSRYLAGYQLGYLDGIWEPFFAGGPQPINGTEEIVTSSVSRAWPVSDAGVGAITYMLEILTGIIGSTNRWRTMPWLVILFGILIVPLGVTSITFIIIQPIVIGTWCTLCLIAAAAMLLQIPYSLDELAATAEFLQRRRRRGAGIIRIFFTGDTDDGKDTASRDEFARAPAMVMADIAGGGVGLPWNLAGCLLIGLWLLFTRLTVGTDGAMADADHLIGSLVITVTASSLAEVARPVRFVNFGLGMALLITPFVLTATPLATLSSVACGAALIGLSVRRGPVKHNYGRWNRFVV